jgi:hypothetical protein
MTDARAMFQAHLRDVVRDVRDSRRAPVEGRVLRTPTRPPDRRVTLRLWAPLSPLWILLAPFALLTALIAAPILAAIPETRGLRPIQGALALGAVLFALGGTVVDVEAPRASIRIRIF